MALPLAARVPDFSSSTPSSPRFGFSAAGGRYSILVFLPPPSPERDAASAAIGANRDVFCDDNALFFGVLPDPETFASACDRDGMRWFRDFDGELRRLFKAADEDGGLRFEWFLIDPGQRLLACGPLATIEQGLSELRRLGRANDHAGVPLTAPVLIMPRVLEPAFCRALIDHYHAVGGTPSGVMRTIDGVLVGQTDDFKRRNDAHIADEQLREGLRQRIAQRLLPEIRLAFNFEATRIERYIVACYDAEDGGYFRPHRDNGAPETAHRKFAVSINLNSEDYEGGDLRFLEYGWRTYRAPTGGAVVFAAGILHEATPVTKGRRYATLPFLYDEAGARLRALLRNAL
jgi:predicted 2-oxoglutarate/Fe(II)-dependent dioxygenase YbiX